MCSSEEGQRERQRRGGSATRTTTARTGCGRRWSRRRRHESHEAQAFLIRRYIALAQPVQMDGVFGRGRVLHAQQACESQLRAIMEAYHPGPLHLFSTLDRNISLAFIADYPTPDQVGRVAATRMEAFCRRHGYSGRTDPAVLAGRLRPHLLTAGPARSPAHPSAPNSSSTNCGCSTLTCAPTNKRIFAKFICLPPLRC